MKPKSGRGRLQEVVVYESCQLQGFDCESVMKDGRLRGAIV